MKRFLITVIVLVSLVGAASASAAVRANPVNRQGHENPVIRFGSHGHENPMIRSGIRINPAIRWPVIRWGTGSVRPIAVNPRPLAMRRAGTHTAH